MNKQRKALALISGGLDSMLAVRLMLEQGIHVEGINFFTGFCVEGHTHAIRRQDAHRRKRNNALWVAEQLGIQLHFVDVIEEYQEVLINPRYGYGRNMNPCLDCKVFMVKKAMAWMQENGFDFLVTGEVMGQRPMSQRKETLPIVTKQSGINDRLLRPLCAKLLSPTLPEREGWVDREKLCGFSGRSRKPQMALAARFGIEEYAQPAGGCCFLTDESYSKKLVDLWEYRGDKHYTLDDIMLLKLGRHLRPNQRFKMIVGREEGENNFMSGYKRQFLHMEAQSHTGPLVLLDGCPTPEDIVLAARVTARFGGGKQADAVQVLVEGPERAAEIITVKPLLPDEIPAKWYL